jgi:hypothetical protein
MMEENETKRCKLDIQERELCLREFQAGLITKDEYRNDLLKKSTSANAPHKSSAEWNMEQLNDDLNPTESLDKDSVDGWGDI